MNSVVVDVDLPPLYERGISPLGERPHSVTVQDLIQYLQATKNAGILAGAKLSIQHRHRAESKGDRTTYVGTRPKEGGSRFNPYDSGRTLSGEASIVSEGAICVSYAFTVSDLDRRSSPQDEMPPQKACWSWSGEVTVEPGKPIIAGAIQEKDSAVFFVLVAHLDSAQ